MGRAVTPNETDPPEGVRHRFPADCSGDLEVSATRENQGGDGTECDHDSTHQLHVDSLPPPLGKALSQLLHLQLSPQGDNALSIG